MSTPLYPYRAHTHSHTTEVWGSLGAWVWLLRKCKTPSVARRITLWRRPSRILTTACKITRWERLRCSTIHKHWLLVKSQIWFHVAWLTLPQPGCWIPFRWMQAQYTMWTVTHLSCSLKLFLVLLKLLCTANDCMTQVWAVHTKTSISLDILLLYSYKVICA